METSPHVADEMSKEEFNDMMAKGLEQAKADDSFDLEEVFAELIGE